LLTGIYAGRREGIDNPYKQQVAEKTNSMKLSGNLAEIIRGVLLS